MEQHNDKFDKEKEMELFDRLTLSTCDILEGFVQNPLYRVFETMSMEMEIVKKKLEKEYNIRGKPKFRQL